MCFCLILPVCCFQINIVRTGQMLVFDNCYYFKTSDSNSINYFLGLYILLLKIQSEFKMFSPMRKPKYAVYQHQMKLSA